MQFYRTNFRPDFVENQFMRTWQALEILYSRGSISNLNVTKATFRRVRQGLKSALSELERRETISESEAKSLASKLIELNRKSALEQALNFLRKQLEPFPAQVVKEVDMELFIKIRNQITHGGVMAAPETEDYGQFLHHQHMRLKSLLDRVFLAMLGQDANLMTFSWEHCYSGR